MSGGTLCHAHDTAFAPPAQGVLYQIVRDHFESFRQQAASLREGEGLVHFVEEEFRAFLQSGWLAGGFARFHCGDCGLDRLIPFSCKGRALCPSCGGRRIAERIGPPGARPRPFAVETVTARAIIGARWRANLRCDGGRSAPWLDGSDKASSVDRGLMSAVVCAGSSTS